MTSSRELCFLLTCYVQHDVSYLSDTEWYVADVKATSLSTDRAASKWDISWRQVNTWSGHRRQTHATCDHIINNSTDTEAALIWWAEKNDAYTWSKYAKVY